MYALLRYMKNEYDLEELSDTMEKLYEEDADHKLLLFREGLTDYMGEQLVLPYAPPLVPWIETACEYVQEWLACPYSCIKKIRQTRTATLLNSDPVPPSLQLHNHDALLRLWNSQLEPDLWKKVLRVPPCDNLSSNPAEVMYEPKMFASGSGKRRTVEQSGGQPKKQRKTKTLPT